MDFYRVIFKGLNLIAWATLGIIAIGIVIAYVTDHKLSIIHNENQPAVSAAPVAAVPLILPTTPEPADMPTAIKSGG